METQKPNESAKPETQPTQTASDGQETGIVDSVIEELRERRRRGFQKYRATMERYDLSPQQWIQHAKEEAMDLVVYLQRLIRDNDAWPLAQRTPQAQDSQQPACASSVPPQAKELFSRAKKLVEVWDWAQVQPNLNDPDPGDKAYEELNQFLRFARTLPASARPAKEEAKSGSGSLGTEIAEKLEGYIDNDGRMELSQLQIADLITASLSAVPAQKEGEVGDETPRTNTGSDSRDLQDAPRELLEACKAAEEFADSWGAYDLLIQLRTAIAKAQPVQNV